MQCVPSPLRDRSYGSTDHRHEILWRMRAHNDRVRSATKRVNTDSPAGWRPQYGETYHAAFEGRRRQRERFAAMRAAAEAHPTGVHYDIDDHPRSPPRPASAGVTRSEVTIHAPVAAQRALVGPLRLSPAAGGTSTTTTTIVPRLGGGNASGAKSSSGGGMSTPALYQSQRANSGETSKNAGGGGNSSSNTLSAADAVADPAFAAFVTLLAKLGEADRAETLEAASVAAYEERLMRMFRA